MVYCEKCGTKLKLGSNFCEGCGKSFKKVESHGEGIKERPTFLKILLGFFLVNSIIEFLMLLIFPRSLIYSSLPSSYIPLFIFIRVLFFVCLYGLYTWKMWGFYGFIILQILGFVIGVGTMMALFGSTLGTMMALFVALINGILILLLYFAMKPVWSHFEILIIK